MSTSHAYNIPGTDQTAATTTKTMLQLITGATRRLWVDEFCVSGKSVNAADISVRVEWVRQSTVGTGSAAIAAGVIGKIFPGTPAMISTAREGYATEPTDAGEIVAGPYYVSPVGGLFLLQIPLGESLMVDISSWLGLRMITPQTTTLRAAVRVHE